MFFLFDKCTIFVTTKNPPVAADGSKKIGGAFNIPLLISQKLSYLLILILRKVKSNLIFFSKEKIIF